MSSYVLADGHSVEMELTSEHVELLMAIADVQGVDDRVRPSTKTIGARLLERYKKRGGSYFIHASSPWHGTSPMARELESMGLIRRDAGMARYYVPGNPTPTADVYYLGLTADGRALVATLDQQD
jgi:hypothetical protein